MEQVGIEEIWKDAEEISSTKIVQVPSSRVRAEEALQTLQRENGVQQEAVKTFLRLTRVIKTMACLEALDSISVPPMAEVFFGTHPGIVWDNLPLILNSGEPPVRLIVPASSGEANYTSIAPSIIPAGSATLVNDVRTTAPNKVPTAAENRQVRTLIMEALQAYCGPEAREWFPNFDQNDRPVMAREISAIFETIEDKYEENENPIPTEASHLQAHLQDAKTLIENLATKESDVKNLAAKEGDEAKRLEAQALFKQTNEKLASPNKALAEAAWYAGETMVRGVGFVSGTVAGIKPISGAVVGATTAAIATFADAGIIAYGATPGAAFSGSSVIGAGVGTMMGHAIGFDEKEAQQAIVSSCILTLVAIPFLPHISLLATAGTLSGVGAVGGALPFALKPGVTAAAQRASNYYAPGATLEIARGALHDWRNSNKDCAGRTLAFLQQAQETDLEAMEALHTFFEVFIPVKNGAHAVEETKAEKHPITPETMTPSVARDILINQIKLRILYREDLMMRLQNNTESIKAREQQSRAILQSSDFRTRYSRGL